MALPSLTKPQQDTLALAWVFGIYAESNGELHTVAHAECLLNNLSDMAEVALSPVKLTLFNDDGMRWPDPGGPAVQSVRALLDKGVLEFADLPGGATALNVTSVGRALIDRAYVAERRAVYAAQKSFRDRHVWSIVEDVSERSPLGDRMVRVPVASVCRCGWAQSFQQAMSAEVFVAAASAWLEHYFGAWDTEMDQPHTFRVF